MFFLVGAGAVVGMVFGVMVFLSKSDFDAMLIQELVDDIERNAFIVDMVFGVVIIFGIMGAVLLLIGGEDFEVVAVVCMVIFWVGFTGGGVVGTFYF
jgi:hypothetical protein